MICIYNYVYTIHEKTAYMAICRTRGAVFRLPPHGQPWPSKHLWSSALALFGVRPPGKWSSPPFWSSGSTVSPGGDGLSAGLRRAERAGP